MRPVGRSRYRAMRQPPERRGCERRWHHERPLVLQRMRGRNVFQGRHEMALSVLLILAALAGCGVLIAAIVLAAWVVAQERDARNK